MSARIFTGTTNNDKLIGTDLSEKINGGAADPDDAEMIRMAAMIPCMAWAVTTPCRAGMEMTCS